MIDYKELKKKYAPSKQLVDKIKADVKERQSSQAKKDRLKYTKDDYVRLAIHEQWKKKLTKKEQSQLFKDIGDCILSGLNNDYHLEEIEFGNGYFIFEFGDNSVIHFRIKELPGWKFGIWLNYDAKKHQGCISYNWFCQYDLWLDKFKPSRSAISCENTIAFSSFIEDIVLSGNVSDYYYDILVNIEFMIQNPYLALYRDFTGTDLNLKYISKWSAKHYMKKVIRDQKKFDKMQIILEAKLAKIVEKELNKIDGIKSFKLIDRCVDGWIISPRYDVEVIPHSNDNLQELYDLCSDRIFNIQQETITKKQFRKYCIWEVVSRDVKILPAEEENEEI